MSRFRGPSVCAKRHERSGGAKWDAAHIAPGAARRARPSLRAKRRAPVDCGLKTRGCSRAAQGGCPARAPVLRGLPT